MAFATFGHRRRICSRGLSLEVLERRMNLTATLYLDFGIGLETGSPDPMDKITVEIGEFSQIALDDNEEPSPIPDTGTDLSDYAPASHNMQFEPLNFDFDTLNGVDNVE